jgi:hypothetical protein
MDSPMMSELEKAVSRLGVEYSYDATDTTSLLGGEHTSHVAADEAPHDAARSKSYGDAAAAW